MDSRYFYLFIYLFKINDRRTRGPHILPEVHKNTQNTQHKLNKGKQTNKRTQINTNNGAVQEYKKQTIFKPGTDTVADVF